MLWTDAKIERLIELYRSFELWESAKIAAIAQAAATASSSSAVFSRWKLAQILLQLAPESGAGIQRQREFPASVSWA